MRFLLGISPARMPGRYPKENALHIKHGKSLKSRIVHFYGEETSRHIRRFEILRINTRTPGRYPKENALQNKVILSLSTPYRQQVYCSNHSFLISALDRGAWSSSHSGHFNPRKENQHLLRRLGGSQSWYGCFGEEKNALPLPGFKPWIIQPIA